MKKQITEIVEFGVKQGISDEDFKTAHMTLLDFYNSLEDSGFIGYEAYRNDDGLRIMVIDWESLEQEKRASNLMMKSPITETFRNSLDLSKFQKRILEKAYV